MVLYNPRFIKVNSLADAKREIRKIGSDTESITIMAPKAITKVLRMENIVVQDAIIIKQDMLSIGGEVAVPKEVFSLQEKQANILIIGTVKQLWELVEKLNRHYPRIREIAGELQNLLNEIR